MSSREERRAKLKQRMENDAANRDQGSGRKPLFNLSDYEDVSFFKAKAGKNEIDILPFEITTDNDPKGTAIGDDNYKLEHWRHKNVGPNDSFVVCLKETYGKPCPICEARKEMLDSGADWKDEEVKALAPSRRCLYNMIDVNDTEKGVQLFEQSHHKFEKPLFGAAEYKNPEFIFFADIEAGYTVTFKGTEETFNKNKYIEPSVFDFEARDPYDEDIYKDVYPLDAMINILTYEEVQALFLGMEPEEKDIPEPKKEKTTRAPRKSKAEPKAEEKPARKGRATKQDPEPEPEGLACPNEKELGLIIGSDWDNNDVCKDCPDELYNQCGTLYTELEAEKKKAKEAAKTEDKPATTQRRRPKRS